MRGTRYNQLIIVLYKTMQRINRTARQSRKFPIGKSQNDSFEQDGHKKPAAEATGSVVQKGRMFTL